MKKNVLAVVQRIDTPSGIPLLLESSSELPLINFMVAFRAGALLDPEGKEGLSRFVARLMRRTAGNRPCSEIDTLVDEIGGSIGMDVGATSILVHGTVITRSYEPFADLLLDVITNPGFSADEREKLRRETSSDLVQARDDDRHLARRAFRRRIFADHPQGRSVSGTIRSLGDFQESDVAQHFRRIIQRNAVMVALSGDIAADRANAFVARLAAALPANAVAMPDPPEPTVSSGRRLVFVDKPERTQTQIFIGGLGSHPSDSDHTALHVANTVFGGTYTARLTEEIRSKRGWSYGAYSSLPYGKLRQAFSLWTFPKASDAAACIALELKLLGDWHERGITKKELASAKRSLTRSHAFAIDTPAKRVGLASEGPLFSLPERYHEEYTDRVQAVTLSEANSAIRNRIDPRCLLVSLVGTHSEIGASVADAIGSLESVEIVPFDVDE